MEQLSLYFFFIIMSVHGYMDLDYLDPMKLQTRTSPKQQEFAASNIISKYSSQVKVTVNSTLFFDHKDMFTIRTSEGVLYIGASSGVAALWGFNYYLKKYCKSHIGWQVQHINIPSPLPEADEVIIANDRFRYYQNIATVSYSFVWWSYDDWTRHIEWMAMNGINLVLAPVAQEAIWFKIYTKLGMKKRDIDKYFTGPAFLSWLRTGNLQKKGGPLPKSWLEFQEDLQFYVVDYMYQLGMVPVLPAFNGHVPQQFQQLYPKTIFNPVKSLNTTARNKCCGLFIHPSQELFKTIGRMFLKELSSYTTLSHIYIAEPFNEIFVQPWTYDLAQLTAKTIFSVLRESDKEAVWLVQNWMFIRREKKLWSKYRVRTFITSVPLGRMLILDLHSEQWPAYDRFDMYFGQPFIWCMLHNFGGTLGMFGNMNTINKDVYDTRNRKDSTMIGIGLTPEGINQNYVVYDLMLESAWRKDPVKDLELWAEEYAERRYGCNATAEAWKYLIRSVYSYSGLKRIKGRYVVTQRPSLKIKPWAWYQKRDLFLAFEIFVKVSDESCYTEGFHHDLVDVTRQALQYRSEQLYINLVENSFSSNEIFNASIGQFLDVMGHMKLILATDSHFSIKKWLDQASSLGNGPQEKKLYDLNARLQITIFNPSGENIDYACKQWAEMFHHYYIPRWTVFLSIVLKHKISGNTFNEEKISSSVTKQVWNRFKSAKIEPLVRREPKWVAKKLYKKLSKTDLFPDLPLDFQEGNQNSYMMSRFFNT